MPRQHSFAEDNIWQIIRENEKLVVTFIDFKVVFDSLSHKFIDAVMVKAGASRKEWTIFRSIYKVTSGVMKVNGTQGNTIYSERLRAVVQL